MNQNQTSSKMFILKSNHFWKCYRRLFYYYTVCSEDVFVKSKIFLNTIIYAIIVICFLPIKNYSQELPFYLQDRGKGIPVSIFGNYVQKGELLIYSFYEYYKDKNFEYEPFDFGYSSIQEFRGRYRGHEGLIYIGYGISDRLAIEFEAGVINADFNKSDIDMSEVPSNINESGISDVEGQIRWRWNYENAETPEFFNYFEYVFPTGKKNSLIGTSDWEFKLGIGLIKGFKWGTITFRSTLDYSGDENKVEPGEYAIEYLKKISKQFQFFFMLEGSQDEVALVPAIQWYVRQNVFLKASNGVGITSKATDMAPEVGIMFSF